MRHTTVFVKDFLKNGETDSMAIARCFAHVANLPSRTVVFSGKTWLLDEAILLPADTTVIIQDCTLKQNNHVFDNVFRGDNLELDPANPNGAPQAVHKTQNIRILGEGDAKIIGCDENRQGFHSVLQETQAMVGDFWGWRTLQISLSRCDGFAVGNLQFSQTRCWAMSFDFCTNGHVFDLHIESNVKNGDGVDFRMGCRDCLVENITGFTSDDTAACTAIYEKGKTYPHKNYIYPMEPTAGIIDGFELRKLDICDITIRNIQTGGYHHGVICLATGGVRVYNITIANVIESGEGSRQSAVKLYTGYGDGYNDNDLHSIRVKNVASNISEYGVLGNAKMDNVVLENITVTKEKSTAVSLAHWAGVTLLEK